MKVLGIYDGHNSNASLIIDGEIVAAIEEERFSRIKNHDSRIPYNDGPVNAVKYCLDYTNADEIDLIALALEDPFTLSVKSNNTFAESLKTEGGKMRAEFLKGNEREIFQKYGVDTGDYFSLTNKTQSDRVERIKSILATFGLSEVPVIFVNHHMAHHAWVYYTSGKTEGLCLSLDGRGDNLSGSVATAAGGSIEMLSEIDSLNSTGHF